VLFDEKRYEEALQQLDAKHTESTAPLYAEMKGDLLTAQGKIADARAAYKTALDRLPLASDYRNLVQLKLDSLGESP
jgi:predicted negative regulator of RcsB-dependent stress response